MFDGVVAGLLGKYIYLFFFLCLPFIEGCLILCLIHFPLMKYLFSNFKKKGKRGFIKYKETLTEGNGNLSSAHLNLFMDNFPLNTRGNTRCMLFSSVSLSVCALGRYVFVNTNLVRKILFHLIFGMLSVCLNYNTAS
jgi:hypothetical protein